MTAVRTRDSISLLLAALFALAPAAVEAQAAARVYIRRIEFANAPDVRDEVLRRQMLVLEGGYLDTVALEQSRRRIERLPYIDAARTSVRPVPGEPDVVDVLVELSPAPPRRYGGGFGYAESLGASLQGYFTNDNVLGTGQRFAAEIDWGEHRSRVSLAHTNPDVRTGVSRTLALASRRIEQLTEQTSLLDAELATLRLEYGYRSGEWQQTALALELQDTSLAAGAQTSEELRAWIGANGDPRDTQPPGTLPATRFTELDVVLRWRRDTSDRTLRPRHGIDQTLTLIAAAPGSEVEYYLLDYELTSFRPIGERWTAILRTELAYGAAYGGDTTSLPPYLNRFAGGPGSVRGIRAGTLGPRDSLGNPYGGNLLTTVQLEFLTPWPGRLGHAVRVGFFYDVGSVFETEGIAFSAPGDRDDFGFDSADLRHSLGLAGEVQVPFGVLRLSYGAPLDRDDDGPGAPAVDEDRLQVSFGVSF